MSWIVYLMGAAGFDSVRDFPEGWAPPPLGPRDAVVRRLRDVLPTLQLTSATEASYHGEDFHIAFDLGPWEPVPRVRLLVQGPSAEALDVLGRVAEALEARALDTGLGDFIRFRKDPLSGRHLWRDAPLAEPGWAPA